MIDRGASVEIELLDDVPAAEEALSGLPVHANFTLPCNR